MKAKRTAGWVLLLSLPWLSLIVSHAGAQSDHHLRWRTIATENFRIHYHEPLGLWARALAGQAETVHARVASALGLTLRQRVEVVLSDGSDAANGFALTLPYNAIHLRAASPDDLSPLADYDDWPTTLLTHEHTHVLHLEHSRGLPRFLQQLFGRFYSPQNALPGWVLEGIAVVEESSHTSAGRVRSTMFDMFLRADALEQRLLRLDLLGFDGEPWPHGNARYLYGQALFEFLRRRHGERALGRFIEAYGRRAVPYGINRALLRATGESFTQLYDAFVVELRARAKEVAARVEAAGSVEGERLTFHGELTRSPRFVSETQLVYALADGRRVPTLRKLELAGGGGARVLAETANVAQLAVVPGAQKLLLSALDYHRGVYAYSELFSLPLAGGRPQRLSRGLRAREPDLSPDGRRVAYVTQSAGTSHLEVAELADLAHSRRVLVRSRRLEQVFTPRWSPDGRRIAYSAFQRGGYRDIWLLDVATGVRTRITYDRALDRGPVFSRDGERLYFSSDRSGIANIYVYELASGALSQLTNVVSGAFQPELSPSGRTLVYVGYGSRGYDLYRLDLQATTARPAPPALPRPPAPPLPEPAALPSRRYQPAATLLPRYWQLAREASGDGSRIVLRTSGADAVGWHGWGLSAWTELGRHDRALELGYSLLRARVPVLLHGILRERDRRDLRVGGKPRSWRAREGALTLGSTLAFPGPLRAVRLRLDYVRSFLQKDGPFRGPLDPSEPPPRLPPLGFDARLFWSLTYASTQRQAYDISSSQGTSVTLAGNLREPYLGSRERSYNVSLRVEQFVRFSFRESVLALAYNAAHRAALSLGGYPAELPPLGDALLGTRAAPSDYARLRGFPLRYGSELQLVQLEYRLLVARINRGLETLPLFARRLHAALFLDAGDAWRGGLKPRQLDVGAGAELRFDWASDYGADYTLRGGIAHGLTPGGELQWYATLAAPF